MRAIDADALIEQQFKNDISYKAFVNLVKRQPTIEERKTEWIPCSERLPEEDGTYIVCLDDRSVFEYDYISKWWDDDAWQYCGKDVVAWMPLPAPYQGEGEEE